MTPPDEAFELKLSDHFPVATYEDWEAAAKTTLKGKGVETVTPPPEGGLSREALYTAAHPAPPPQQTPLHTEDHALRREQGWDLRARLSTDSLGALEESLTIALAQESHSLWLPQAAEPASTEAQLASAFDALQRAKQPLYWDVDEISKTHRDHYIKCKEANNSDPMSWRGGILFDPVATLARNGHLPKSIDSYWQELAALARWGQGNAPEFRTVLLDATPLQEAGAAPAYELGCTLSSLTTALRGFERFEGPLAAFGSACEIRVAIGGNMFVEMAKLRALRICVRKVLRACGIKGSPKIHALNSRSTMATRDHWVNLLRGTAACFGGAAGGADAISLYPFDGTHGSGSTLGLRQALNIQHVLAKEAHLHKVIDPAGGAWYIEHMTDQLARGAWAHFQAIEAAGGLLPALEQGKVQEAIAAEVAANTPAYRTRKRPILGVSEHANLEEETPQTSPLGASPHKPTPGALSCDPLVPHRWSAAWEALRDASDAYQKTHGKRPSVYLMKLGSIPAHKARASFATRFFAAGGFDCIDAAPVTDASEAATAFAASGAQGVAYCGKDDAYPEHIPSIAAALQGASSPTFQVVAGRMGEHEAAWREAGVTHAIHLGCDALGLLQQLQELAGVTS